MQAKGPYFSDQAKSQQGTSCRVRQSRAPAYTVSLGQSFSYLVAPHPPSFLFILPTLSKNSSDLSLSSQGAYYTQPVYAAQPHVIHHTTVVQPNSIPSAIYPAPVAAPRTNGVAMGMVAGTTMAMSAGKGNICPRILCCLSGIPHTGEQSWNWLQPSMGNYMPG